jgi:hypothetical protein
LVSGGKKGRFRLKIGLERSFGVLIKAEKGFIG